MLKPYLLEKLVTYFSMIYEQIKIPSKDQTEQIISIKIFCLKTNGN
jgi:hypothetical protein